MRKSIILRGPLLTRSGYGEQARFALRSLRSREDLFDIYIHPLEWGKTSWINEVNEERTWIDNIIEKTISHVQNGGTFDYSLQVTIPNEWENIAALNIGYTAGIETTKVAHEWLQKGNAMTNIVVVSNHSKEIFNRTQYEATMEATGEHVTLKNTTDIEAVNYPVKEYKDMAPLGMPEITTPYNFVCVAQFGPRKNLHNTIKWFIEEFAEDEEVGLVVKTNIAKNCLVDRDVTHARIASLLRQHPDRKCKVYLLHGDMTDEEMHALYLNEKIHAALSFTHGEGFGLPLFEAAYMGIPVVATAWSGQLDFLCDEEGKENFYSVAFDINQIPPEVVWDGVLVADSMWAFPRETSAKQQMRKCIDDIRAGTNQYAVEYAKELHSRFSEEKMYKAFIDAMGIDEEEFDVENWLGGLDIEEIE